MLVEAQHIEAIGRYVVGGTTECHHPEEEKRTLQPPVAGYGESNAAEGSTDEQLHSNYPPTLRLQDVNERAPKGLDDPRKVKPRGVQGNVGIGHAKPLVENERYGHYRHVGHAFGEIECGHPSPRGVEFCV